MDFLTINYFTHEIRGNKILSCSRKLTLPHEQALRVTRELFCQGEGYTSVNESTLAALGPKDRKFVETV